MRAEGVNSDGSQRYRYIEGVSQQYKFVKQTQPDVIDGKPTEQNWRCSSVPPLVTPRT